MREQLKVVRYTLTENPVNLVAFALFGLLALAALFGPMLSPLRSDGDERDACIAVAFRQHIGSGPINSVGISSRAYWWRPASIS